MILLFSCEHHFLHQKGPEQRLKAQNITNLRQISMRVFFIFESKTINIHVCLKRDMLKIKTTKKNPARQTDGIVSELVFTPKPHIHSRHHHPGIRGDGLEAG